MVAYCSPVVSKVLIFELETELKCWQGFSQIAGICSTVFSSCRRLYLLISKL